jgi:hypothetical protein
LAEYPSHDSRDLAGKLVRAHPEFHVNVHAIVIDSPDTEDDYATRLGRRLQLEADLHGKLTFDDVRVFERLHLDRVAAPLVEGCVEALNQDQDVREARREVESTIESVIREEMEYEGTRQDEEERWDPFSGREYWEVRHFSTKKEIYKPLVRVAFLIPRRVVDCNSPTDVYI